MTVGVTTPGGTSPTVGATVPTAGSLPNATVGGVSVP